MSNILNNIKLSKKLPFFVLCSAITLGTAIGVLAYNNSKKQLTLEIESRLATVTDLKQDNLKQYLKSIQEDLITLASSPNTINALKTLDADFKKVGANPTEVLQKIYIDENPNPIGKKDTLLKANDGSDYSQAHSQFHPWFHDYLEAKGYYDIFLINTAGDVVYTYFKERDFATNMQTGKWKDTDIANAFRKAINAKQPGEISYFNFKTYAPSENIPAAFIIAPIFENNAVIGAVAFQMPISRINDIMKDATGLGETGQAYLVDQNGFMNSDSRFSDQTTILSQKVETQAVQKALQGQSGVTEELSYSGKDVIEAYEPFEFLGTKWAMVSEITRAEAFASIVSLRNTIMLSSLVILAGLAAIAFFVSRSITKPISETISSMNELSKGNLDLYLSESDRSDEIGDMIKALHIFKRNALETKRLEKVQQQEREKAHQEQIDSMQAISKAVDAQSQESGQRIGAFASEITQMATNLNVGAKNVYSHSERVSGLSKESMSNTQMISSAAEELSASIREIEQQMESSKDIIAEAVKNSTKTENTIENLSKAIGKISEFTTIISEIADKTNLLALNATIEAARAGEAGKGFAVVANEVKDLANQTANSTEEISKQIKELVTTTRVAVVDVRGINESIGKMNDITNAISVSIEHQSLATQDISNQITHAARSAEDITSSMGSVIKDAEQTDLQSGQIIKTTTSLQKQINEFSHMIQNILHVGKAERREMPRTEIDISCQVEQGGRMNIARLVNISLVGAGIEGARGITKTDKAVLHIEGFPRDIPLNILDVSSEGHLSCSFDLSQADQTLLQSFINKYGNGGDRLQDLFAA